MVKHIVFFKLTGSSSPESSDSQLEQLKKIFGPLGKKLPFIIEYRTGTNFTEAGHAWDFAIDSVFANKEDLRKYLDSAEHLEAVKEASSIEKIKAVIDYEF